MKTRRGNDHPVGRIGMKISRQPNAADGDRSFQGRKRDTRQRQRTTDPSANVITKRDTPLLHQHGDLPRRDRRNQDAAMPRHIIDDVPGRLLGPVAQCWPRIRKGGANAPPPLISNAAQINGCPCRPRFRDIP
jgi:hypothetical protein